MQERNAQITVKLYEKTKQLEGVNDEKAVEFYEKARAYAKHSSPDVFEEVTGIGFGDIANASLPKIGEEVKEPEGREKEESDASKIRGGYASRNLNYSRRLAKLKIWMKK